MVKRALAVLAEVAVEACCPTLPRLRSPGFPTDGDPRMAGTSDGMLNAMDEEVRRITDECYSEARRLLRENRETLDRIVERLLDRETLDEAEVYEVAGIERPASAAEVRLRSSQV